MVRFEVQKIGTCLAKLGNLVPMGWVEETSCWGADGGWDDGSAVLSLSLSSE